MQRSLLCVAVCCFALLIQAEGLKKQPVVQIQGDDDPELNLSVDEENKGPKHEKKNVNVTRNVYIIDDNPQDGGGSSKYF